MSILADTSGLLVLLDADHARHQEVRQLAQREAIIVPSSVLHEVDYMAAKLLGEETARTFLADVLAGEYDFLQVEMVDMSRAQDIIGDFIKTTYLGFVDATLVALAERYRVRRILTLDRRHFSMFRPKGLGHLELLP